MDGKYAQNETMRGILDITPTNIYFRLSGREYAPESNRKSIK